MPGFQGHFNIIDVFTMSGIRKYPARNIPVFFQLYEIHFTSLNARFLTGTGAPVPRNIVDVGCGIGGSSRYLSKKFGAKVTGITLSPVQAARAGALAAQQGLADKVSSLGA
jgi:SAM-dependent methyltransferase